jgi:voltage-gated potassium channel
MRWHAGCFAGMDTSPTPDQERERLDALQQLDDWLETPMVVLGFVWLALLVTELVRGLGPVLEAAGTAIWVLFLLDFGVKLTLAPDKGRYVRRNWLTAVSLLAPAVRVLRVTRLLRASRLARVPRGLRLVKVVGSMNRGMRALGAAMGRRGFGYVVALTALVTFAGAAGMYAFEREEARGFQSYPDALWWTAMILTTMGSEVWPATGEGRLLCFLLALYAFAVFGYVTATLASFFVGRDAEREDAEIAGERAVRALSREVAALRAQIDRLRPTAS